MRYFEIIYTRRLVGMPRSNKTTAVRVLYSTSTFLATVALNEAERVAANNPLVNDGWQYRLQLIDSQRFAEVNRNALRLV